MSYNTYSLIGYIKTGADYPARIIKIDQLIDALLDAMLEFVGGPGVGALQVKMDDGQMKVDTTFKSVQEIKAGIDTLEQLKQSYMVRCRGRVTRLQDEKTLRR